MCLNVLFGGNVGSKEADSIIHRGRLDGKIDSSSGMQPDTAAADRRSQSVLIRLNRYRHWIPSKIKMQLPQLEQIMCHIKNLALFIYYLIIPVS